MYEKLWKRNEFFVYSFVLFSFLCVGVWHASMCASVWTPIVFLSYSPSRSLSSSIQLIHSKDPISGFQAGVNSRQAAVPTLLQGSGLWSSWHYEKHFEHRIISLAPISFVLEHLNRTCVSLTIFNVFQEDHSTALRSRWKAGMFWLGITINHMENNV